jgi:hypothetical protein
VIRTGELLASAFAVFGQHGAAMRADSNKCPHETILSADNKDWHTGDLHRLVIAGFAHFAGEGQQQRLTFEDEIHLAPPSDWIYVVLNRDVLDVVR